MIADGPIRTGQTRTPNADVVTQHVLHAVVNLAQEIAVRVPSETHQMSNVVWFYRFLCSIFLQVFLGFPYILSLLNLYRSKLIPSPLKILIFKRKLDKMHLVKENYVNCKVHFLKIHFSSFSRFSQHFVLPNPLIQTVPF